MSIRITRRDAMKGLAALGAGLLVGGCGKEGDLGLEIQPGRMITVDDVQTLQYRMDDPKLNKPVTHKLLAITATDGTIGICDRTIPDEQIPAVREVLEGRNLADHVGLWRAMMGAQIPDAVAWIVDVACWDLHGRVAGKPVCQLLGQRRKRFRLYGDQRLHWYNNDVDRYAAACADAAHTMSENHGIKLHFGGTYPHKASWGVHNGVDVETALRIIRQVRQAVGPDTVLAWDPEPQEAAADNLDNARRILDAMDRYDWGWIESPMPASPQERQMEKWLALRPDYKLRFELEYPPDWAKTIEQEVEAQIQWASSGACNQWNWESRGRGLTPWLGLRKWIRTNPARDVRLNQHCQYALHMHMAASLSDAEQPMQEWCGCPARHVEGGYLNNRHDWVPTIHEGWVDAPSHPGVFAPDWDFINAHRV